MSAHPIDRTCRLSCSRYATDRPYIATFAGAVLQEMQQRLHIYSQNVAHSSPQCITAVAETEPFFFCFQRLKGLAQ